MGLFAIVFSLLVFTGVRSSYSRLSFSDRFERYDKIYDLEELLTQIEIEHEEDRCALKRREELIEIKTEVQSLTALVDGFLRKLDPDYKEESSVRKPDLGAPKTDVPKCPSGFEYLEQSRSCYKVIFGRYDRNSASRQCERLNSYSHLVSITSRNESDALKNYLEKELSIPLVDSICRRHGWSYPETAFWTSAQRVNASDCSSDFAWKDGTEDEIPFAFTNWNADEPNCYQDDEDCVEIIPNHGSTWNDVACRVESCPICEFDPE